MLRCVQLGYTVFRWAVNVSDNNVTEFFQAVFAESACGEEVEMTFVSCDKAYSGNSVSRHDGC